MDKFHNLVRETIEDPRIPSDIKDRLAKMRKKKYNH